MNEGDPEDRNREKIDLGIRGEDLAEEYLTDRGYAVIARNERVGHSDIDILARKGDTLVFVEVRTKSVRDRGMPEETLSQKKLNRMRKTAELYMAFKRYNGKARLDAVCIVLEKNNRITHFEHYKGV